MSRQYCLVALPGEGIGPEVVGAALKVLRHIALLEGFSVEVKFGYIGEPALKSFGSWFPEQTAQLCDRCDGILFGAVTKGGILELRKRFDLFANLRPVRTFESLLDKSSLQQQRVEGLDLLFVRELVSASLNAQGFGLYEAIHGTAPDIAGKGIANPLGTLEAVVLMLQQWEEDRAAQRLMQATQRVLTRGYRTLDLAPQGKEVLVNTEALTELLVEELYISIPNRDLYTTTAPL